MPEQLRAVVVGAGWAGEGHTKALQWCGVEVVAICARRPDVVRQVADRLGVAEASADWRETIERLEPDIVSLATPGGLRLDVVEAAAGRGCHILCDKPLAPDAATAERVYRAAEAAGVKHAYAATHRYGPQVAWLAELVREGAVGRVREIVGTFRTNLPALIPWSWALNAGDGGGWLNNGFTHHLGIMAAVSGGEPLRAMGRVDVRHSRAPVLPDIHDFRQAMASGRALTPEAARDLEWRDYEADLGFAALVDYSSPSGVVPATVVLGPGTPPSGEVNGWRVYGEEGTLQTEAGPPPAVSRHRAGAEPEPLPIPQRLLDDVPQVGDNVQNWWCALARDFVADVRGEPHRPYLTFRDGSRYQVAIDAVRAGTWRELPG